MRKLVILMVVAVLVTAGCGDDEDGDSATTDTTAASSVLPAGTPDHGTAEAEDGMEVELDDFYFGPTVIEATPGQAFKVELFNEGGTPHTFTIDSLAINVTLSPEQRMEVTITAPEEAGTIPFYCKIHQASSNMQGALVVA
jgi:plastocyanin